MFGGGWSEVYTVSHREPVTAWSSPCSYRIIDLSNVISQRSIKSVFVDEQCGGVMYDFIRRFVVLR